MINILWFGKVRSVVCFLYYNLSITCKTILTSSIDTSWYLGEAFLLFSGLACNEEKKEINIEVTNTGAIYFQCGFNMHERKRKHMSWIIWAHRAGWLIYGGGLHKCNIAARARLWSDNWCTRAGRQLRAHMPQPLLRLLLLAECQFIRSVRVY